MAGTCWKFQNRSMLLHALLTTKAAESGMAAALPDSSPAICLACLNPAAAMMAKFLSCDALLIININLSGIPCQQPDRGAVSNMAVQHLRDCPKYCQNAL